jgi:hypothetical protein
MSKWSASVDSGLWKIRVKQKGLSGTLKQENI